MHGKYIYLACEDGSVKILKVKKNKIEYVRALIKIDQRCLSLDLVPENTTGIVKQLFAGYGDSSIRKYDLVNGNSTLEF